MKKTLIFTAIGISLAGCANATRTIIVPTVEERTVSGERVERAPLVVPLDYRSPILPAPMSDHVIRDWNKNNYGCNINVVDRSTRLTKPKELRNTQPPLPTRRPCSMGNTRGCDSN